MARHYSYRVHHDLGFAPHVQNGLCTVCGCKPTTIERWASPGSWIVGIAGKETGQQDKLLYAMEVVDNPSLGKFKRTNPKESSYLKGLDIPPSNPVLVAKNFYYFGHNACVIPSQLEHIVHKTQGCKRLSDGDIILLKKLILSNTKPGKRGRPTMSLEPECGAC